MTTEKQAYLDAKAFAISNVVEGAAELLEWRNTAILRDGVVRKLAAMLKPVTPQNQLGMAESLIVNAALNYVANREGR